MSRPPYAPRVHRTCLVCGSEFPVLLSAVRKGRGVCCSRNCGAVLASRAAHAKYSWAGENNPKYRDGRWQERKYQYKLSFQARNPEKAAAHRQVSNALKAGRLQRGPCEVCGATDNIQAHHDDYSKVFDVRWFCRTHHIAYHKAHGSYQSGATTILPMIPEMEGIVDMSGDRKGGIYRNETGGA